MQILTGFAYFIGRPLKTEVFRGPLKLTHAQSRDFFIYDQNAFKQIAREEGFKEGKQAGLEQGLEKGLFNVARTMIAQEFPLETIATVTGLSIEVIERLAKEEGEQGVGD